MAQVTPSKSDSATFAAPTSSVRAAPTVERDMVAAVGGILYLIGTVVLSYVYLDQIQSSLANDYWWPDFNSTGVQTFLGDVYNSHLVQTHNGTIHLLDGSVVYSDCGLPLSLKKDMSFVERELPLT